MPKISSVDATSVFDSRGNPTLETLVQLDNGVVVSSAVPAGVSVGSHEALDLRDNKSDWQGLGVSTVIENIKSTISKAVIGQEVIDQKKIDRILIELDGTSNKSKLGANAILSVSQAVAKAAAVASGVPLHKYIASLLVNPVDAVMPTPLFNVLEGGVHASNGLNFQEFLVIPATSKNFHEKMKIGSDIYQALKKIIMERSMSTANADEGGFAPDIISNAEGLNMLRAACDKAGYKYSLEVFAGIDCGANHYFSKSQKQYKLIDNSNFLTATELTDYYIELFDNYGLLYLEDPFSEDDIEGWQVLSQKLVAKTLIAGDDVTTTNPYRLQMALDNSIINSIVIKPSQIGTVTETMAVVEMARFKKLKIVVANRAGETHDTFIADFAVGVRADYVKFGALSRERIVKYNRLIHINDELSVKNEG